MVRSHRFERPQRHYALLRAADGNYLGTLDGRSFDRLGHADDKSIWEPVDGGFRHVLTGFDLGVESAAAGVVRIAGTGGAGAGDTFTVERGPATLPSQCLSDFRANGWVCLTAILDTGTVEALERVACTGRWSEHTFDENTPPLLQHPAVARVAAEPVSLWLARQYLQTDAVRFAHAPSIKVLARDDGRRDVQGWHSDFPYLWGSPAWLGGDRVPAGHAGGPVLGVQRNVCISPFTEIGGATCFRLGSHALGVGPPRDWGIDADYAQPGYRAAHGLPYSGPQAEVIEAPAGSIILYDARTWHRAGVNRTEPRRAAMLQAITPMFILPFKDTSGPYRAFVDSPLAGQLTARERREIDELLVHRIVGPLGDHPIATLEALREKT